MQLYTPTPPGPNAPTVYVPPLVSKVMMLYAISMSNHMDLSAIWE